MYPPIYGARTVTVLGVSSLKTLPEMDAFASPGAIRIPPLGMVGDSVFRLF